MLSGSGTVSSKRVVFMLVVLAGIVWLSIDLRNGTSPGWVSSFQALLAFAGGSYVLGKGVERLGKEKDSYDDEEVIDKKNKTSDDEEFEKAMAMMNVEMEPDNDK